MAFRFCDYFSVMILSYIFNVLLMLDMLIVSVAQVKTGGLVVWSRKDCIVAYRGCNYSMNARFQRNSREISLNGQTTGILSNHQRLERNLALPVQNSESENMDMKEDSFRLCF